MSSSFLEQTRKRSAESSIEISAKRKKIENLYQNVITNMVEILLTKYVDHLFDKVHQGTKLGQNKCRLFIFEDCDSIIPGLNLMKPIFSEFIRVLTTDPKLFKGFHIKVEKICVPLTGTHTVNVYGVNALTPKYFMDVIWKEEEAQIIELNRYDPGVDANVVLNHATESAPSHNEVMAEEGAHTLASLAFASVRPSASLAIASVRPTTLRASAPNSASALNSASAHSVLFDSKDAEEPCDRR